MARPIINHAELVRACARNAEVPAKLLHRPADVPGRQRRLLGPCDDVVCPARTDGIDFEAELAVVTGDVPMGATPERRRWTASAC
jgi:fumarylacetoacetate (FAA) hydrolase